MGPFSRVAAVHGVVPEHRYEQAEVTAALARMGFEDAAGSAPGGAGGNGAAGTGTLTAPSRRTLDRFHASAGVATRHLALPLERYGRLSGFQEANDAFIAAALDLGAAAVTGALERAGLTGADVDLVVSTSVTGVAVPSVEARLAGVLGLRPDVKRVPLFGLGCVAGAAGIARVHDYLLAYPDQVGVLLSVELCSLTLQRGDRSTANLVASALFGDGAAAVVMTGADRTDTSAGPRVVATRSRLYPDTERVMGWDIGDGGFRIVLGADVPDVVRTYLAEDVTAFLADHGLTPGDVGSWVCHPGGPKVLDAVEDALGLPPDALDVTRRSLAAVGNLSSASVLHVLRDTVRDHRPPPGTPGLLLAMGPGFCAELCLLEW